ncbi:MAG: phosphoenolpyruvate--protein phosphotransferase [Planctomycetes bacterium]|nr:phosphoenolpyruvate--protein phosphotransferase [Planctomycetota bacterium]
MSNNDTTIIFNGQPLSPGMGEGKVFVYRDIMKRFDEFYDIDETKVEQEVSALDRAFTRISNDLEQLQKRVKNEINSDLAGIFHAHQMMIQDPSLKKEVENKIREELVSAGSAVKSVFRHWERRFSSMNTEVGKQKGDDMIDLARRLILALAGVHGHALEDIPRGSVLVANRLLPSDTVFLERNAAAAAILEFGGKGSHAALFAREIGLPCVAGIKELMSNISEKSSVIVDANQGEVIINPTPEQEKAFRVKQDHNTSITAQARKYAHESAITKGGQQITVLANVGDKEDTQLAIENGADGIGLYRLEQIYLSRQTPPTKVELIQEITDTLKPAKGLPVYIRLLDVGADKPLPFLDMPRESNPSLGQRGVRFLLEHPDLLQMQLNALLEISSIHDVHILVPMITLPSDMLAVRKFLEEAVSNANVTNIPKLGAMIETPAAALTSKCIMEHSDFLSFGTNDLTQYLFSADRENPEVDDYFDDTNTAIFRLISMVHADTPDASLSVCGELAGRSEEVSKLVKSGITSLSVVPPSIPIIKEAIRKVKI